MDLTPTSSTSSPPSSGGCPILKADPEETASEVRPRPHFTFPRASAAAAVAAGQMINALALQGGGTSEAAQATPTSSTSMGTICAHRKFPSCQKLPFAFATNGFRILY